MVEWGLSAPRREENRAVLADGRLEIVDRWMPGKDCLQTFMETLI